MRRVRLLQGFTSRIPLDILCAVAFSNEELIRMKQLLELRYNRIDKKK